MATSPFENPNSKTETEPITHLYIVRTGVFVNIYLNGISVTGNNAWVEICDVPQPDVNDVYTFFTVYNWSNNSIRLARIYGGKLYIDVPANHGTCSYRGCVCYRAL